MWCIGQVRPTPRAPASGKPFGPGEFGPNPSALGLDRAASTACAEGLDLVPNFLRQNGSILPHLGLADFAGADHLVGADDTAAAIAAIAASSTA